ncbi:3-deoxy-7-phosphoheptulonate synthase [Candidatus Marinamargulisbacteria bacterium SCGC AG-414-C22]|nr:3-deoxy-7-phosphoheptulonate synthase [Candidatus Marinamargulisbacteria bacterium SCGC AG-414-C22]
MSNKTENLNIEQITELPSPSEVKSKVIPTKKSIETVVNGRKAIENIIAGKDDRILVVIGPCSIHDTKAAYEYAEKLVELSKKFEDKLLFAMRVYFEKPRTTLGWKGLINDPDMDQSFHIEKGLIQARQILNDITEMGLSTATEMLDTIIPQYIADLVCWGAIGARTVESQPHREMSSGLSMPIGFKNATTGDIDVAINAVKVAIHPHHFLGAHQRGDLSLVKTKGNPNVHVILRGGTTGPNYDPTTIKDCAKKLEDAKLPSKIMIDCSHANSKKKHQYQCDVIRNVTSQIANGNKKIMGLMIESNLEEGNQPLVTKDKLKYGVSVTDECISWKSTEDLLTQLYNRI